MSRRRRKITSFRSLPVGWHYSQGGPLSDNVINKALQIDSYYRQLGFTATDAFPGADGELMITAYRGPHCIETVISSDARYSVTHERDDTEISATLDVDETTAKRTITRIGGNMALVRLVRFIHGKHYDKRQKRFRSLAFKNSRDGGISIILRDCVDDSKRSVCQHIRIYYPARIAGEPQFTGSSSNQYFLQKIA